MPQVSSIIIVEKMSIFREQQKEEKVVIQSPLDILC